MINFRQPLDSMATDLIAEKFTIILEQTNTDKRKDILDFFDKMNTVNYYAIMGRKNSMLPFLTVEDNMLLGISKKQKKEFLLELDEAIITFKVDPRSLKKISSILSERDQMLFQIIRALILKQNIIIFDYTKDQSEKSDFLLNIMPILNIFTKQNRLTAIIVTSDIRIAESNYYNQCILLDNILLNN